MSPSSRSLRWIVAAVLGGAAVAIALGSSGCDDPYEPPCRVTTRRGLASDPLISARPAIGLARVRDRIVATWTRRDLLDGGAGADAGTSGPPLLTGFEVAIVDDLGELTTRATVPAPEALRARRASVEDAGVVVLDGGFIVHWTETTTSTDPDGRLRTASVVKASRVSGETAAEPATIFACEQCVTSGAIVPVDADAVALVRIDPDVPAGVLGAASPPRFVALRLRPDGSLVEEAAPWLALPSRAIADGGIGGIGGASPASPTSDLAAYVTRDGLINVTVGGRAWLADDRLRLVAGPIEVPSASDVHVSWEASGEAAIGWSVSPFDDGRASDPIVPREIFTGIVPSGAAAIVSRERTSRGRATLAFDRRGDDLGIVFESAGRTLFASVDRRGNKHGGDVVLGSSSAPSRSEYGSIAVPEAHALVARGDRRFTLLTLGAGELVATEVVCAP